MGLFWILRDRRIATLLTGLCCACTTANPRYSTDAGAMDGQLVTDAPVSDGPMVDVDAASDGSIEGPSQLDGASEKVIRPVDGTAPEFSKQDSSASDALPSDILRPDTLRPDTLRPDTLRPDTLRPDTLRPDTLRPDTLRPDTLRPDVLRPDTLRPDVLRPDTLRPDTLRPPPLVAFSAAQLLQALKGKTVPCVLADGSVTKKRIPVLDEDQVHFWDDSAFHQWDLLVQRWVGTHSAVVVVVNPNACEKEDPASDDDDWQSAGIVIRNARLVAGKLLLAPTVTTADMNVVEGSFKKPHDVVERFKSDDSGIPPQLRAVFRLYKQQILALAGK